MNEAAVDLFKM